MVEITDDKEPGQPCKPERGACRQLSELQRLSRRPIFPRRWRDEQRSHQPTRLGEVAGVPARARGEVLHTENAELQSPPNPGGQLGS